MRLQVSPLDREGSFRSRSAACGWAGGVHTRWRLRPRGLLERDWGEGELQGSSLIYT